MNEQYQYRGYVIIQKPSGYYLKGKYSGITETLESAKEVIDILEVDNQQF